MTKTDPLNYQRPIVDPGGRPKEWFIRQWLSQILKNRSLDGILDNSIIAGTGLDGGGKLSAGDVTLDLEDTAVVAGTYGTASAIPRLTIDAQGRITGVTTNNVSSSGGAWWFDPPLLSTFTTAVTEGTVSNLTITDDGDVGMLFEGTINSAENAYMRLKTAPTAPFTITAKILGWFGAVPGLPPNNHQGACGLVIRDSTSGQRVIFGVAGQGRYEIRRAIGTGSGADILAGGEFGHGAEPVWLRMVVDANHDVSFQISATGKIWRELSSATAANAATTSLDQVGFGISMRGSGGSAGVAEMAAQYYAEA